MSRFSEAAKTPFPSRLSVLDNSKVALRVNDNGTPQAEVAHHDFVGDSLGVK
jgi:hypothetical protein